MYPNQLGWPERGQLWLRLGVRLTGAILAVVLIWKAGPVLLSLFMPFLLALGAAALLNPVVRAKSSKASLL